MPCSILAELRLRLFVVDRLVIITVVILLLAVNAPTMTQMLHPLLLAAGEDIATERLLPMSTFKNTEN